MNIELATVISAVAMIVTVINVFTGLRRASKNETRAESSELTTVIVKLENIGKNVDEIKTDIRGVREDIKDHGERLVGVEQQIKVLNKTVFGSGKD